MPESEERISASVFKATCLALLDRLAAGKLSRLVITKRGKPMAVLMPVHPSRRGEALFGCLKGSVEVPPGVDLTAPTLDEPLSAARGRLHE